ncbi:hypothetical protein FH972_008563 [Carpinus fangiana]|uniref:Uncharacterized protein n=1 Tax=Carpinus fangiana TaxID=176857 RepID=A0A5N6QZ20_9ROSI|nr:hypothetical protein FH972_008563 [Carpinus fangiana]
MLLSLPSQLHAYPNFSLSFPLKRSFSQALSLGPSLANVSLSPISLTPANDPVTGFGGTWRVRSQHDGGFALAGFCSDAPTDYLRLSLNSFYPPSAMLSLSIAPVSHYHSGDTHSTTPALSQ